MTVLATLHDKPMSATWLIIMAVMLAGLIGGTEASTGIKTFTVAKNLPAKMSTKYLDRTYENANLSINGDTNGEWVSGARCMHTGMPDAVPWWMVDMLKVLAVFGTRVWNRLNCCSHRFSQISLGVSEDASVWTSFNKDLFSLCIYWTGVPTASTNPIYLTCPGPILGRYLALYKNMAGYTGDDRMLHFCEIDIFAVNRKASFKAMEAHMTTMQPTFSPSTAGSLLAEQPVVVSSKVICANRCLNNPSCLYIAFAGQNRSCWFFKYFKIHERFASLALNSDSGGSGGKSVFLALRADF